MAKKSKIQQLEDLEDAIARLDNKGLTRTEIIAMMTDKGVPQDVASLLITRVRSERRQKLFWDGIKALLFGGALLVIVLMAWFDVLDIRIGRQIVVALMGGAVALLMLFAGVVFIVQSFRSPR